MHSYYGKDNVPGGRSRRIAESQHRWAPVHAYALLSSRWLHSVPGVVVERSVDAPLARLLRFAAVRGTVSMSRRRAFAVGQFDLHTARRVKFLPRESVAVLHIWNWLPRTIATVRDRNPAAVIVRDVSIAREFDFEWGEDIRTENEEVDLFVSPSQYASDQLCSWGIPGAKVRQVEFGVDVARFRPKPETQMESESEIRTASDAPLRFAFSGALSARKGVPELLQAWERLSLRDAELHLYGRAKPEVADLLKSSSRVHTHGFVDLAPELPRNDVFVFPSHLEGSAKSVFEALACGLPVITTPNAGSVVRDGIEGHIVPAGSVVALQDVMKSLYRDPQTRGRMAIAARDRAEEFPWERYARRIWQLYAELGIH